MSARSVSGVVVMMLLGAVGARGQVIPTAPQPLGHSGPSAVPTANVQPTIISGDPTVPDFPTPFDNIDSDFPDSPLAGVVSIFSATSPTNAVYGSGVAIDATHILTAAHVVDFAGGLAAGGAATGDGVIDASPLYSKVYLNNLPAPMPLSIASVAVAPGWTGFNNTLAPGGPSNQSDLAIITLASPLPATVPTYGLDKVPFAQDTAKIILMAGYGGAGDARNGLTQPATVEIKHYGWNVAALYQTGLTPPTANTATVFISDFDPSLPNGQPDPNHGGIDGYTSVGNDFEATIAPGDSGGPAFLVNDLNGDGLVQANELTIFGLDTFTFDTSAGAWPHYDSGFGGTIVSAYTDFIDAATGAPEPGSLLLVLLAASALVRRRRR